MTNPFHSARLIYRAVELEQDAAFFLSIQQDPMGYRNSNAWIARPQSTKDAKKYMEHVAEKAKLGVVICLPAADTASKPTPIGTVHLSSLSPEMAHHRFTEIGIDILPPYQGQGYGSEAIRWVLEWAFETAAMHRVSIRCFGYNTGARRLYERLGFKLEGITREEIWCQGQFWDGIQLGMLDREWREMRTESAQT